jgi:thiol:disulfide interchange protein
MGPRARWGLAVSFLLAVGAIGTWYWLRPPTYSSSVDAHIKIAEAEWKAAAGHKRVLIVFGANWCFDCHVLDDLFERPDLASVLAENYEVVYVNVGVGERNRDLMAKYQVPFDEGIPAVAIVESDGTLIYSQKHGEFENARRLTPEALLDFLKKWKLKTNQPVAGRAARNARRFYKRVHCSKNS